MPHHAVTIVTLLLGLALSVPAHARITRIDIEKVESPTFDGASFGNSGPYEKLTGKAYGELDPAHELNRNVVLLDKAPRNAAGRVEYSIDILILKPVDMSRGNRTLIYDSVNRGNLRAIQVFNIERSHRQPSEPRGRGYQRRCCQQQSLEAERRRRWISLQAGLHHRGERLAGRRAAGRQPADRALSRGDGAGWQADHEAHHRSTCRSPSPLTRSAWATTAANTRPYPAVHGARVRGATLSPRRLFAPARDHPEERVVVRQVPRRQERDAERRRRVLPGRFLA